MLRSIMQEIVERTAAIETLEAQLETLSGPQFLRTHSEDRLAVQAALATHRRELRRANQELPRIGCARDDDHPARILIRGESGDMNDGFAWNAFDESLHELSVQTTA
jgi:hypothetical protein